MEAPPDLSDPAQIAEWQNTWDALMIGDQSKLRQIRWVPAGSKYQPVGPGSDEFDSEFPLYLMRRTCAAHGVTPADLGFTETVNKATSEVQVDVQFRVGTLPLIKHVEDVINLFLSEHLKLRVRLRMDTGREIEDRLSTANAEAVYIRTGVISPDEPRARLGYPVSLNRPTPRFIDNTRSGPIPLIALESMAGDIDPETFGPAKGAPLVPHPFVPMPGVMPPIGSKDNQLADQATAEMSRNMNAITSGQPAPFPADTAVGSLDDDQEALKAALTTVDRLLARLDKAEATAGITASTGMTGVDMVEPDTDEIASILRRWRENARNRLRKGLSPRRFTDAALPDALSEKIWAELGKATTREEVDRAFLRHADDADLHAALSALIPEATRQQAIAAAQNATA